MQLAEQKKADLVRPANVPPEARLLEIRAKCVYEDEQLLDHLRSASARPIPHFSPSPQHDHEIALCGAGPSIKDQVETIRSLKEAGVFVMAIKSAHDFLIGHGIIPDVAIMVDPQPHIKKCFQKKRDDIVYMVASQCHPEIFDYFKDNKVVLWHLLTGKEGEKEVFNKEIALGGGSTSGMRGMTLAWAMGFRKMHMFGYDSSMPPNSRQLKIDGSEIGEKEPFKLWIDDREFISNPAMSAQATEFEKVMNSFKGQIQVRLYGDGAIPHIAASRIKRGLPDVVNGPFKPLPCHRDYWKV